ncbi:MAG: polysaccharide deacetylase family protein [Clostridia bacterium]|nr:polysaccharide deacetylase family protein [Clostridia bacterium]
MKNNKKYAVFTMDVEDFADAGCLAMRNIIPTVEMYDGIDAYIDLLEKHGIRATLFTLKSSAVKLEDRLCEYSKRGHEIAIHGYDHTPLNYIDSKDFHEKLKDTKEYLEGLISKKVVGFRAPFFSMDSEKFSAVRDIGFRYDSSSHAFTKKYLKNKLIKGAYDFSDYDEFLAGAYEKDSFFEFSLSCENILGCAYPVSGGGYVRLCPWFIVGNGLKRYIRKNDLYVFYLHPFELSKNRDRQLRKISPGERFYLNSGISEYAEKIERIIEMLKREGFQFVTFEELCDLREKEK